MPGTTMTGTSGAERSTMARSRPNELPEQFLRRLRDGHNIVPELIDRNSSLKPGKVACTFKITIGHGMPWETKPYAFTDSKHIDRVHAELAADYQGDTVEAVPWQGAGSRSDPA